MYIVLEGIIRSGKTTQSKLLHKHLKKRFKKRKITYTREPGGSQISEAIRKLVQATKFDKEMYPITDAYVYASSRAQALREVVAPGLKNNGIVVSDRSFITSLVYQGYTQGLGMETVYDINKTAVEGFLPDIVIFLDVKPEIALQRDLEIDQDKWEAQDITFFRRARNGYKKLQRHDLLKDKFHIVDANRGIKEIHRDILEIVDSYKL